LFGTYESEEAQIKYGISKSVNSPNPLTINIFEYQNLFFDLKTAKNTKEILGFLFSKPRWKPKKNN